MNIVTTQKTTTVFDVAMDAADVKDLLAKSLRQRLSVDGCPGVTVSVDMGCNAAGEIVATASIAVESSAPPAAVDAAQVPDAPAVDPVQVAPAIDAPAPAAPVVPGFAQAA